MLKPFKIVKRDGRVESFDPNKANGWGEYGDEGFRDRCDTGAAIAAAMVSFEGNYLVQSVDWHMAVIKNLVAMGTWPAQRVAGRMYMRHMEKEIYGGSGVHPTLKELHTKLQGLGLMRELDYSDADYAEIEAMIDHEHDMALAYFQIEQFLYKYAIKDRSKKNTYYETPQFILMRMAMALCADDPVAMRLVHVKNFYKVFRIAALSSPSPNYEYLGTPHHGLLSCCLFGANDNAGSLAAAFHIAHEMTLQSAGLGAMLNTRTVNDLIKNGMRVHNGKFPYHRGIAAMAKANVQGNRGGAVTTYNSMFDPEAKKLMMSQSHKSDQSQQLRDLHMAMVGNRFLAQQVQNGGHVPMFTSHDQPKLWEALFSKDTERFGILAKELMESGAVATVDARELVMMKEIQSRETSTLYYFNATHANHHTPFLEPIRHSNLCTEIMEPNTPYDNIADLYLAEDHGRGEIAMCAIASINVDVIDDDDELYELTAYYALRMIYKCIQMTDYAFPHLEFTAKARRNAAVGMVGNAAYMARRGLGWDTPEGLACIDRLGERHWYFVASASCKLAEEFGPAPWIHKTKYPQGYSVLDTYERNLDKLIPAEMRKLRYDHAALKERMIRCGGGAFSCLVSHFPNESSSKVLPGSPNSYYEVREDSLLKEDKGKMLNWCARDNDVVKHPSVWTRSPYAIFNAHGMYQKWADGGLSADRWEDRSDGRSIEGDDALRQFIYMDQVGMKSHYYFNTKTPVAESSSVVNAAMAEAAGIKQAPTTPNARIECAGGCD